MGGPGNPFGPMWFRIMFPGLVAGFLALTFGVVLATHPGQPSLGLLALGMGLLILVVLAALFIGAGLLVGGRARFKWRGCGKPTRPEGRRRHSG